MAGLTAAGFEINRLPEVIEDHNTRAATLFADLTEVGDSVDTSGNTTLGRLIGLISPAEASIWEALQQLHSAFIVTAATGVALDNLVALSGITRLPASPSRTYVLLTGMVGTTVPATTTFLADKNATYRLDRDIVLDATSATSVEYIAATLTPASPYAITVNWLEDGIRTYTITSGAVPTVAGISQQFKDVIEADPAANMTVALTTDGALKLTALSALESASYTSTANMSIRATTRLATASSIINDTVVIEANTLTTIQVAVFGLSSVTNPVASTPGRYLETDEELRVRFRNSKFQLGTNIIEALYSELINVSGVKQVVIYENDTDVTDEHGVLPHSFLVLINGGFADDIAYAIWNNRPTGIRSQGAVEITIIDKYNIARQIKFSRPVPVDLYVSMDIEQTSLFPENGEEQIRAALVAHFDTATMGAEVLYSRLYTPINSVVGHYINSLQIGTEASPTGTSNIAIPYNSVARLLPQNITFT